MTVTLNPEDPLKNQGTYKIPEDTDIYIPDETVIEQELNKIMKKIREAGKAGDLAEIQAQVDMIATLLSHQNSRMCREYIQRILPEILNIVKEQAGSYQSVPVLVLTVLGGLAQIIGSAYGAYGIADAINNNALKVATQIIAQVSSTSQGISAFGSVLGQGGGIWKEWERSPQETRQYSIQVMNNRKDQNQQFAGSADGKENENLRALQQVWYTLHQTISQILGQTSA